MNPVCSWKEFWLKWDLNLGPGCSKLTKSLVNVLLKFQTLVMLTNIFVEKSIAKASHFVNKNISVFGYKVVKNSMS